MTEYKAIGLKAGKGEMMGKLEMTKAHWSAE